MGPDWNFDGNHDWQDDAFFMNVIDSDSEDSYSGRPSKRTNKATTSSNNSSIPGWVIALGLVILAVLIFK